MAFTATEKFTGASPTTTSNTKGGFSKTIVVSRSNTTKDLRAMLPAGAYFTAILVNNTSGAASNAATTAAVTVFAGNNTTQLATADVKTAVAPSVPSLANLDTIASVLGNNSRADIPVYIQYTETGTASSTGGPWAVTLEYVV